MTDVRFRIAKWILVIVIGFFSIVQFFLALDFSHYRANLIGTFYVIGISGVILVEFFEDMCDYFMEHLE